MLRATLVPPGLKVPRETQVPLESKALPAHRAPQEPRVLRAPLALLVRTVWIGRALYLPSTTLPMV